MLLRAQQERRSKMTEKPQSRPEGKQIVKEKQKPKPAAPVKTEEKSDKLETKVVSPSVSQETKSQETEKTDKPAATAAPKPAAPKPSKKEEAIARGKNLHASKKHCMYICSFIKNKPIDQAISELQEVLKFKRIIPMKGEIPHRSAPGIMSGRYPIKTTQQFIPLLKALKGNAIVNGMELDKTRITYGSATWASRPQKRGGMRFKRSFVVLKAREVIMKENKKSEIKK